MTARSPWSKLGDSFLSEGDWAIGQGPDAPDRQLLRALLLARASGPFDLLEVGMGPGIDLAALDDLEPELSEDIRYQGFDLTPELVDVCRTRFPGRTFEVRDMLTMKERDVADVVYTRHTLEHVADVDRALKNLLRASRDIVIVSWFIRPTWCEADENSVEADGFLHNTYSARRLAHLLRALGVHTYRFDIDHHLNRGAVWILSHKSHPELAAAAHAFIDSKRFVDAVLPVPPDPRERESDLLDILEEAHASLGKVIPAVPRVTDMLLVLQEAEEELQRSIAVLDMHPDDENAVDAARRARDARERVKAALGDNDPDAEAAAQAARDAQARIESALIENGRFGG